MPLSKDEIAALLSKPTTRRGGKKKAGVDTNDRSYNTWFKLAAKLFDENVPDGRTRCENPNCPDTRPIQMVAEVNGKNMCRRCFIDGWMTMPAGQQSLDTNG